MPSLLLVMEKLIYASLRISSNSFISSIFPGADICGGYGGLRLGVIFFNFFLPLLLSPVPHLARPLSTPSPQPLSHIFKARRSAMDSAKLGFRYRHRFLGFLEESDRLGVRLWEMAQ